MTQSVINSRNIMIVATLVSLIGITPMCSGDTYKLYNMDSEAEDLAGLTMEDRMNAVETVVEAYQKDTKNFQPNGDPYFAKADKDGAYYVLFYPMLGCGSSCYMALLQRNQAGELIYQKDVANLACDHPHTDGSDGKRREITSELECQEASSGLF